MLRGEARTDLPEFLRRMISLATSVRELHFKVRLNRSFRSDRPGVVGFLPPNMEWRGDDVRSGPYVSGRYHHIRRIRVLRMWGIYISRGAVSAEATRVMGWHPHHCKGASTNCDCGSPLGGIVARTNCTLFV